jgi:ubiquinone/menaquinone biosynthesis C-methylase UbiE
MHNQMTPNASDAIAIQRKYYTETAACYEEMHGSEGSGDPFQMDFVIAMLRMLQVKTLLDVGTASGRALRTLKTAIPELFICGVEPVGALLDEAVARGNAESGVILQGRGDVLPFGDNSFDAVCEFAILHHVPQPHIVVAEMLRVAKRVVILTDSNRFGQGPMLLRLIKIALWKSRLWNAFNYLRTAGKGYQITEGDGLAYSYSIYDSFDQIVRWADRVIVIPSDKIKPAGWVHPLLTSPGVILCAIRER